MSDEMNDKIKELQQQIFYEKVLKKIFNIKKKNDKDNKETLENPKTKLGCELTDYYNYIFSTIKTACLINNKEIFPSDMLNIEPNELKSELGKELKYNDEK